MEKLPDSIKSYSGHAILTEHPSAPCVVRFTHDCDMVLEDYGTPVLYCKYTPMHDYPQNYTIYPLDCGRFVEGKKGPIFSSATKRHMMWFLDEYFHTDMFTKEALDKTCKAHSWFLHDAKKIICT